MTATDAGQAADVVTRALDSDVLAQQRAFWVARHFGDISAGASMRRFVEATTEIVGYGREQVSRTEQRAAELAGTAVGPDPSPTS